MNRIERKLLINNGLIGVVLCLLIAAADHFDYLISLERWLYDRRVRDCGYFTPPPTDRLVHLDIDDSTLEGVGRWPWPREYLAHMVDEIARAGATAVAFDVVFSEAQEARYETLPDGSPGKRIEGDPEFAQSLERFGRALLSNAVAIRLPRTHIEQAARDAMIRDVEMTRDALWRTMVEQGLEADLPPPAEFDSLFIRTVKQVMFDRVEGLFDRAEALGSDAPDFLAVRQEILPHLDPNIIADSPLLNILRSQYGRMLSVQAVRRYSRSVSHDIPVSLPIDSELPPIPMLVQASAGSGFVTYLPDSDGVVRKIPLWVDDGRRLLPQLGLALAAAYLNVLPQDIRLSGDRVTIPREGGPPIEVPVRTEHVRSVHADVGMIMDIPWFGPVDKWEYMYDPEQKYTRRHLPLNAIWQVHKKVEKIAINNRNVDMAISVILDDDEPWKLALDPAQGKAYRAALPDQSDVDARERMVRSTRTALDESGWLAAFKEMKPDELTEQERFQRDQLLAAVQVLDEGVARNRELLREVTAGRLALRDELAGRAAIIGWTGTAAVADFVPTSLHHKCPGVVVHGVVFNAIMTGEMWRAAPDWLTTLLTLVIGLMATAAVARLSPLWATSTCALIGVAYLVVNGIVLFDYGNYMVGAAGPLVAVVMIWSACTLSRFIVERTERARITRRFSSYVDPALVNYVIDNPESTRLDGERKELTVVFTDLAGFTTLSEKLGERTVPMLNEYMGIMVPIIRQQNGYVNKFLGDGIMFFYGAPLENTFHAANAIDTVLKMQVAMDDFNKTLTARDLPNVSMRVGVSTGYMVVGDAGSTDASDYTVLGDSVNLGARLESANKYTGSRILINERTAELVRDLFLLRPIARLQVVGKSECVMTYEPLTYISNATDDQKKFVELSEKMVNAFIELRFQDCIDASHEVEQHVGAVKIVLLYRKLATQYLKEPPEADKFDGTIELTEK